MRTLDGLSQVVDGYDGFILDLWGVLHDGQKLTRRGAATVKPRPRGGEAAG